MSTYKILQYLAHRRATEKRPFIDLNSCIVDSTFQQTMHFNSKRAVKILGSE